MPTDQIDTWKPPLILRSREGNSAVLLVRPLPQDDWQPPGTPRQFHEHCLQALEAADGLLKQLGQGASPAALFLRCFVGCARLLVKTPASVYQPFALAHKPERVRFDGRPWPSYHHAAVWNCEQLLVDLEHGIGRLDGGVNGRTMPLSDFVTRVLDQAGVRGLRLHEFPVADLRERCVIEASWLPTDAKVATAAEETPGPGPAPNAGTLAAPDNPAALHGVKNSRRDLHRYFHALEDPRPERYAFGPLAGNQRELGYAVDPRARLSASNLHRHLQYAAQSTRVWIVAVRRQQCEVYFESRKAFVDAESRLADFRAQPAKKSKRVKKHQRQSQVT